MLKHVKGVPSHFSYVYVWEEGFLPVLYQAITDWFQSGSEYPRGDFVKGVQKGNGSQIFNMLGVFILFWDQGPGQSFAWGGRSGFLGSCLWLGDQITNLWPEDFVEGWGYAS